MEKLALRASAADGAASSARPSRDAARAAHLCKADLVSQRRRRVHQRSRASWAATTPRPPGRRPEVAPGASASTIVRASPATRCPTARAASCVAFADKLDTICGLFAIGERPRPALPTRSRCAAAAIGIVTMLRRCPAIWPADAIDASLDSLRRAGHRIRRRRGPAEEVERVLRQRALKSMRAATVASPPTPSTPCCAAGVQRTCRVHRPRARARGARAKRRRDVRRPGHGLTPARTTCATPQLGSERRRRSLLGEL